MNIRVLDKMIRLLSNSLYILQKMLSLFRNGGFLLMILNARISLMLTGHASQVHLMTIMNSLPPAPFSLMSMNLPRKLRSSVSTFVLQMQLKSDDAWFTLTSAVTTLCVSLTSASVQLPATAALTQSSPQPTLTTSPAIHLSAVSAQSLRQLPLYSVLTRGICIFCRGRWWQPVGSGCRARQAVPEEDSLPCPTIFIHIYCRSTCSCNLPAADYNSSLRHSSRPLQPARTSL